MSFIRDTIRILPSSHSPALLERENSVDLVFPICIRAFPNQVKIGKSPQMSGRNTLKNQSCLSNCGCAQLGASGKCQIFQLAEQRDHAWRTCMPHCEHCSVCTCHSQILGFPLNWMLKSLKFLVIAVSLFFLSCVCTCACACVCMHIHEQHMEMMLGYCLSIYSLSYFL